MARHTMLESSIWIVAVWGCQVWCWGEHATHTACTRWSTLLSVTKGNLSSHIVASSPEG